jgi:hypothetical protein
VILMAMPPLPDSHRPDDVLSPGGHPLQLTVGRATGGGSLIEALDRLLDKGIVIDAWIRVALVGIDPHRAAST